jgi:myo-inositol catabolism protein IolS
MIKTLKNFDLFSSSRLVFGGASLSGHQGGYGFGPLPEDDIVEHALERGIRIFDTAPIYGFGHSEEYLGQKLKDHKDSTFVISKGGITWNDQKRVYIDNSPQTLIKMLDGSLKRLNRECIDGYMLHWPCSKTPLEASMESLIKQKAMGKIGLIGLSHFPGEQIREYLDEIDFVQWEYNLFSHKEVQENILPLKQEKNFHFIATSVFDRGILAGSARGPFDVSDFRRRKQHWNPDQAKYEAVDNMIQQGVDPVAHSLRFVFENPAVDLAAIGFRRKSHVDQAIENVMGALRFELRTPSL